MLKLFLIWFVILFGTPIYSQTYNVHQYELSIVDNNVSKTYEECYVSPIDKKSREGYLLTITTDRYRKTFAVLRTFVNPTGSLTLAVVIGKPDQLYSIREETRIVKSGNQEIWYYFLSINPVNQGGRTVPRDINGTVLEVSNKIICK